MGYCPLHGEVPGKSTPSLCINIKNGLWYCFSEGRGGGLQQLLKALGKSRAVVDRTMRAVEKQVKTTPTVYKRKKSAKLFYTDTPLPEKILGLFDYLPEELIDKGFDEDILWEHDVGYNHELDQLTFPIRDIGGNLAGISAKNLNPDALSKYKVYRKEIQDMGFPEYELDKKEYLWRWEKVYAAQFSEPRPVTIVAEGFKACLWIVQSGFPQTVGLMGSSMSDTHQAFFERIGGTLILSLDNDEAGINATYKIARKLKGCKIRVIDYPDWAKQPDDLEPEQLIKAIKQSLTFTAWRKKHNGRIRTTRRNAPKKI